MRSVLVFLLIGVLASPVFAESSSQTQEVEVQQASERFFSAFEAQDASAAAASFTETGILMIPGLPDVEGRPAVGELLEKRFATLHTSDRKLLRREIHLDDDSAYELGWFSETSRYKDDDANRLEGRYLIVWQRDGDNGWLVHRYVYNFSAVTPL